MMEKNEIQEKKSIISIIFSLIFSIISIICISLIISHFYHPQDLLKQIPDNFILPVSRFAPEPVERTLFITGTILAPALLTLFFFLAEKFIIVKIQNQSLINKTYKTVLLFSFFIILLLFLIDFAYNPFYYRICTITHTWIWLLCLTFLFSYIIFYKEKQLLLSKYFIVFLCYILILIALWNSLYDVYNFDIKSEGYAGLHLGTVLFSIFQVFSGKPLLITHAHQYGLYPHFLEPILKLTGLSVFKFTILMGILQVISFLYLYKFLREITSNIIIASVGFLTLIFYSYLLGEYYQIKYLNFCAPYYQYYPIRFFFPALSIYITWKYFNNKNHFIYFFSFPIYALSVLWNFDTGCVVFISWILILIYKELNENNNIKTALKNITKHVIYGLFILVIVSILYVFYIKLRYGLFPDFTLLLRFQKLYYFYGYSMLPMSLIHPWNLVILLYLCGLSCGVKSFFRKDGKARIYLIVFLSILGTGLFSYFQARSHPLVLMAVSYPAILLLTIFTDRIYCKKIFSTLIPFMLLSFFLFSMFIVISILPFYYISLTDRLEKIIKKESTRVARDAAFISSNTKPQENVLILSTHSGVYHIMSNTVCPLNICCMDELSLKEDYDILYKFLKENKHIKVFIDNSFFKLDFTIIYSLIKKKEHINLMIEAPPSDRRISETTLSIVNLILNDYKQVKLSSDGTMMLCEK